MWPESVGSSGWRGSLCHWLTLVFHEPESKEEPLGHCVTFHPKLKSSTDCPGAQWCPEQGLGGDLSRTPSADLWGTCPGVVVSACMWGPYTLLSHMRNAVILVSVYYYLIVFSQILQYIWVKTFNLNISFIKVWFTYSISFSEQYFIMWYVGMKTLWNYCSS